MKEKHKKLSWTAIIVTILVLTFLLIIIFKFSPDNSKNLKTITISGQGEDITITDSNPSAVYISGMNAVVHFSKTSNPEQIYLTGINAVAYLCKGIHNPEVSSTGLNAKVVYNNC